MRPENSQNTFMKWILSIKTFRILSKHLFQQCLSIFCLFWSVLLPYIMFFFIAANLIFWFSFNQNMVCRPSVLVGTYWCMKHHYWGDIQDHTQGWRDHIHHIHIQGTQAQHQHQSQHQHSSCPCTPSRWTQTPAPSRWASHESWTHMKLLLGSRRNQSVWDHRHSLLYTCTERLAQPQPGIGTFTKVSQF